MLSPYVTSDLGFKRQVPGRSTFVERRAHGRRRVTRVDVFFANLSAVTTVDPVAEKLFFFDVTRVDAEGRPTEVLAP